MKYLLTSLALVLLTGCSQSFNLEDHRVNNIYCDSMDVTYNKTNGNPDSLLCFKADLGTFLIYCSDLDRYNEPFCTSYSCETAARDTLFSTDCKTK